MAVCASEAKTDQSVSVPIEEAIVKLWATREDRYSKADSKQMLPFYPSG
jgi:hypothetical protein